MTISFARHQFPPSIIRHAVWLYVRFTLSYRDVEDLLAERGLDVSYERVRRWVLKFGPLFARELRHRRSRPTARWHLDEMAVTIAGRRLWLWRAVDDEGEVLDLLVQRRRDKAAAVKLMRKLIKKQGFAPDALVTDKPRSYSVAKSEMGLSARHEQGLRRNNRAENSHQPIRRRERKMQCAMHKFALVALASMTLAACATRVQTAGTTAGAVGGAVVGGPVGAVVGGATGAVVTAPWSPFGGGTYYYHHRYRCRWYDPYGYVHYRWCY